MKRATIQLEETIPTVNKLIALARLACISLALCGCTTTYREGSVPDEHIDESSAQSPDCSLLADEAGCQGDSPFDPDDDEQEF